MSWKLFAPQNSEYRKRLESLVSRMQEVRDKMIETETAKLKHLAETMQKVNEHNERLKNGLDT